MTHDANDLIDIFNRLFQTSENTILIGGYNEPLYLPSDEASPYHRVIFTRDYFASALHEIAHWCIAGSERRLQIDYGYWYYPEGRNRDQQQLFEQAEVKPQALECLFARAAGSRFFVSQDNLSQQDACINSTFADNVAAQAELYLKHGLPERANQFLEALLSFYGDRRST
jgi:elongation factor P hydroxylase